MASRRFLYHELGSSERTARTRLREAATHFERALRERGVIVIDPLPELEKGDNPLQYHFRNDGHWNPRGHRLIGEMLRNALSGDK